MKDETKGIRTQLERTQHREHSAPIFMTSSFTFSSAEEAQGMFADEIEGCIYSRYSNPNTDEFITKLCHMEGAEDGIATATGMAAVFASMAALLQAGDHVLASSALFGSTFQLLTRIFPKWGIEYSFFSLEDQENLADHVRPNTKMIVAETPSNPGLDVFDIELIGKVAKEHNLIFNVDNCFATPYLQNPLKMGAHIITHSATKFIDGQGRSLGGAVLGDQELIDQVRYFARHTGPSMSPFNAWTLSKSLETLPLRMEKHCENAYYIAETLSSHPELEKVKYPFLESHPAHDLAKKQMKLGGGLLTIVVKGGIERAKKFLNNLKLMSLTPNLGDTRTAVTHPTTTTHSKLTEEERMAVGITPGLIRFSIGLEHPDDILADIHQALDKSKG